MSTSMTSADWQMVNVLADKRRLFILWAVKVLFCTRIDDFRRHLSDELPVDDLIRQLELDGFLQRDGDELVLTDAGEGAVAYLDDNQISEFAQLGRPAHEVEMRFQEPPPALGVAAGMTAKNTPANEAFVEQSLINQLRSMGWDYLQGDPSVPYFTDRASFNEVLLIERLSQAIRAINGNGLSDTVVMQAIEQLKRVSGSRPLEVNQAIREHLVRGVLVTDEGQPHQQRRIRFLDFGDSDKNKNDYLVINQFRVDVAGGQKHLTPDIVLFINGIPMVVIECKSPTATNPIEAAISQLMRYSQQGLWSEHSEHIAPLFFYNQLLIATSFYDARVGTLGSDFGDFSAWKDPYPATPDEVAAQLGVETGQLSAQQVLVAGVLRKSNLLDLIRHFILFQQRGSRTTKIAARYQQFRAVNKAIDRLLHGSTKGAGGDRDQRGGIIWHTQGSGKSLTMVFLVRKMRTIATLQRFKVVVVTDRRDLQEQLSSTAMLANEPVRVIESTGELKIVLRRAGPELVFAMIQKYRDPTGREFTDEQLERLGVLNTSPSILVLVDEAHRSQSKTLHANLDEALPNSVRIAFTGTPIMVGDDLRHTEEIFGPFIDRYTIQQSEADGATVPILYESRRVEAAITDQEALDRSFTEMFRDHSVEEQEAIKNRFVTIAAILEARELIESKARDIFRHYVVTCLPDGFKAMVVATTRLAAARYVSALNQARAELLATLSTLESAHVHQWILSDDEEQRYLARAYSQKDLIARLDFAAVFTPERNDEPELRTGNNRASSESLIAAFRRPFDSAEARPLSILCVQGMLLTGFDAPVVQTLYLDRFMRRHTLLQAIARVNRIYPGKTAGMVVDYIELARFVREALDLYRAEDVQGALANWRDEIPKLHDRHLRAVAIFRERGLSLDQVDACVNLLRDSLVRADFIIKLRKLMASLDIVLPRREALDYVTDAEQLALINQLARNRYRDTQLNLVGAGYKIRELLDQYIEARGVMPGASPTSITDPNFEDAVSHFTSEESQASEMEHATRAYIDEHYQEDPVYYQTLSERLDELLRSLHGDWVALIQQLKPFAREVRQGPPVEPGLHLSIEAPFYRVLAQEYSASLRDQGLSGELDMLQREQLKQVTRDVVPLIRQEVARIDFWRPSHAADQQRLRTAIIVRLDASEWPLTDLERVADRLIALARTLHTRLVS